MRDTARSRASTLCTIFFCTKLIQRQKIYIHGVRLLRHIIHTPIKRIWKQHFSINYQLDLVLNHLLKFLLLWHNLGFWLSISVRVFRIHFHKKTNYKGKGRGVKPKTRWGMIVARSRLWLWVRRVGGDSFFWGPGPTVYQWKVEPWQASPAWRGLNCCRRHYRGREGKTPLILLSHHLPTSQLAHKPGKWRLSQT